MAFREKHKEIGMEAGGMDLGKGTWGAWGARRCAGQGMNRG
jgi:hypothetical protein